MPIYRIAGQYVDMAPKYRHLQEYAEKYLYDGQVGEDVIKIGHSEEYLQKKRERSPHLSLSDCEYIYSGADFASALIERNGFVLHSSAVGYNGYAYIFSAASGTGKSTHTAFWQEVFGSDNTVIINDDKPAVIERDGEFYASGTPFSGKSSLNSDVSYPIRALCFIHRSEENEIKRISAGEAVSLIMEQTLRPSNMLKMQNLLSLLDRFLKKVPVYSLGVAYSPSSAVFAYEEINKDLQK